jgi:hypothetical protein
MVMYGFVCVAVQENLRLNRRGILPRATQADQKGNDHAGRVKAVKLLKTRRFGFKKFKLACERIALVRRKFGGHFSNELGRWEIEQRLRRKTIL